MTEASQLDRARISSSLSFSPGTIRVVISTWQYSPATRMERLTVSKSPPSYRYQFLVNSFKSMFAASISGNSARQGASSIRKAQVTGMKAARRFFLDGIQSQRGELAVVQRYDGIAPVGTNPTKTGLSFAKNTAMKTKSAFCAHVCRTTWKRWMV